MCNFLRVCIQFLPHACSLLRKEDIIMDLEFDELIELEIMDLENLRDELNQELESGCSLSRELEIQDELDLIQSQLYNLY